MLEDNIIQRGAPHKLISDRGQALVSNKVADIFAHPASKIGRANPTSTITPLNGATKWSRTVPIASLIALVHLPTYGWNVSNMCVSYSLKVFPLPFF
jgi:hypothetical protein